MSSVEIKLKTRNEVLSFSKMALSIPANVFLSSDRMNVDGKDIMDIYKLNLLNPITCTCDDDTFLRVVSSMWGVS